MDLENAVSHKIQDAEWRRASQPEGWVNFVAQGSNMYTQSAKAIRDEFCIFFNSEEGQVSWQWSMI